MAGGRDGGRRTGGRQQTGETDWEGNINKGNGRKDVVGEGKGEEQEGGLTDIGRIYARSSLM